MRKKQQKNNRPVTAAVVAAVYVLLWLAAAAPLPLAAEKMAPETQEFYNYAHYLFTKEERKIFNNLPDEKSREEFIKYFWEIRDPNPYTSENEFKEAMEERFDHVRDHFKEGPLPGWRSDRGQMYILLGPPSSKEERRRGPMEGGIIYWYYESSDLFVVFIDRRGLGTYRIDHNHTSLRLMEEIEHRKYHITPEGEDQEFWIKELKFDFRYDPAKKALHFSIETDNVHFEDKNTKVKASFKVAVMVYQGKKVHSRHTVVKSLEMEKSRLLEDGARLEIQVPLELPSGKVGVDVILSDSQGYSARRKLKRLKIK